MYMTLYIPPNASLKEQTWMLEIEEVSFNDFYKDSLKELGFNSQFFNADTLGDGYIYIAPIIKAKVKNLETGEVHESILSFQQRNFSYICNRASSENWCYI